MKILNLLLYTLSAGLYLACTYGIYNMVSARMTDTPLKMASIETHNPKTNSLPPESTSSTDKPTSRTTLDKNSTGDKKNPINAASPDPEKPEDLDVLAERAEEAGIDVEEWSDMVNETISDSGVSEQLQAMTAYAAQTGIDVEDLTRLAGNAMDSSQAAPKLEALKKIAAAQTGDMKNFAVDTLSKTKAMATNITSQKSGGNANLSSAGANVKAEDIKAAQNALAGGASAGTGGAPLHPDEVSSAMKNLSANVNTLSSVPDSLKDAVKQAGIEGREIDPNKEYFAGKPVVSAASSSAPKSSSSESENTNSMADNIQMLAAAGKGLADMAGNLSLPEGGPEPGAAPEPDSPAPPAKKEEPEKTEEPAKASAPSDKPAKTVKKKSPSLFSKYKSESIVLGTSVLLILYWQLSSRKKTKKGEGDLKAKYDKAHQCGWTESHETAKEIFEEILEEHPEELDARLYLAGILWRKLGEPQQALEEYKKLEKEIARQAVDYRYKDRLSENIEELTQELQKTSVAT
ncbi:hypothetical protein UZ36_05095 [Candidatus Nitromaritima sp. SCGC AAA799-C22]|nr:hypothetical protein UZ36_05095 [Candidatus Nitromaritima sp. SCGC AAA799-C22]